MTMLVALLLAFTEWTSAEETNMNVSGKQMVQELTNGNMSIGRNHSVATSNVFMPQSKALLRGTVNGTTSNMCFPFCQALAAGQAWAGACEYQQCFCTSGPNHVMHNYCNFHGRLACFIFCINNKWPHRRCGVTGDCLCSQRPMYNTRERC